MPVPCSPGGTAPWGGGGGMCKGQKGDRWGPATPGMGGPTGPGCFGGRGWGGRVGAGAAPHPGGLTRIVQPRESSRECRGEGGSPGRGCLGRGRGVGDTSYVQRGAAAPLSAPTGESARRGQQGAPWRPRPALSPVGGGGLVRGRPRPVPAPLGGGHPRGGFGGGHTPVPLLPRHHHPRRGSAARARWRGGGPGHGGGAAGSPPPHCANRPGGSFPLCITGNEP